MSRSGLLWVAACAAIVALANVALRLCMEKSGVKLFSNGIAGIAGEIVGLVREPRFYVAIASYAVAMLIWFRLIATEPLSVAYPALAATSFIGVTVAGFFFLNEPVAVLRLAGIALIVAGLALVAGG